MRELKSEARNSNVNALSTPAVTCVRTPGAAKRHAYGILQCLLRDGAFESVGIGEGTIGQIMLLEVAPASLDVVQFGGVFRQPLDGEPGALGEGAGCQLAGVDRPVVENRDQGPGAFSGAVGGAKLVEQD